MRVNIPLGIEFFSDLREKGFYYVDKTAFIGELLRGRFTANLITRPRRFGKTLTMSMLEDFFDISKDSKKHFEGLKISKEKELCAAWMNQYPVIFLSLKSVEALNFPDAYGMLEVLISNLCRKYDFLNESALVDAGDKETFGCLNRRIAEPANLKESLLLLSRMLHAHYGKKVILLVDEYDVPLAKAHEAGYYAEMLDMTRAMLGAVLKTNPHLEFAVITGCLKISKESVFTGINNLVVNTITTERFDESIGFTETDVKKLLEAADLLDHADEMRQWYDGYRFGRTDIYCPWDVLNHMAALQENPNALPRLYWADSSSNNVIYKLFENKEFDVNDKFETLLAGGSIREAITEELTYNTLEASEENLWSLLFMTGYLTLKKAADRMPFAGAEDLAEANSLYQGGKMILDLKIPNEELKIIFRRAVVEWFRKEVQTIDRTSIFHALWEGDEKTAEREISDLLFDSISYHDYRESYYHAFVAGLFIGAGYIVESNYEYGDGRPDVVVKERKKRRVMLFEVRHAGKDETLEHACRKAAEQIQKKRYTKVFDGYRTIISYGIAFKGKNCMIKRTPCSENPQDFMRLCR